MEPAREREETAIVLDYLQNGYSSDNRPSHMKTAIAQAIGSKFFSLLELVPRKDIFLTSGQEVYIGEGKRDEVHHIGGRLTEDKLSSTARAELEFVIKDLVAKQEKRFVEFFNKAQPLSTRMHTLELLPGLGKKHMWEIIEERKEAPFESFATIKSRVKLMPDPQKLIVKRILAEIAGKEKHRLFVK